MEEPASFMQKVPLTWEDRACRESYPVRAEGTFKMQNTGRRPKIVVSNDGNGIVSQAGALLFEPLQEALALHARLEFTRQVRVVPAALGQNAGLVGAAALVSAGERYWRVD